MADYNSSWSTPETFEADIRKGVAAKGEVDNLKNVARTGSYNDLIDKPTKTTFGLGNVDNTSDLAKPISTATQTALNNKVDKISGKGLSTNDYTTADKNKLAGLSNYDDSVIKAEISAVVNSGVKNLFNCSLDWNAPSTQHSVISESEFIISADARSASDNLALFNTSSAAYTDMYNLKNGEEYTFSTNNQNLLTSIDISTNGTSWNTTPKSWQVSPFTFTVPNNATGIRIRTRLKKGEQLVNSNVKIMLRDASITDDTFVPYAPTNRELYEMILALTQGASTMSYTDDLAND